MLFSYAAFFFTLLFFISFRQMFISVSCNEPYEAQGILLVMHFSSYLYVAPLVVRSKSETLQEQASKPCLMFYPSACSQIYKEIDSS